MHLALQLPDPLLPETFSHWRRLEASLAAELPDVLETAEILLDAGAARLAARLLTGQSHDWLLTALAEAEALVAAGEVRVRNRGALNLTHDPRTARQIW